MAVTFSLPTVLARLADGRATLEATGTTLGDVVAEIAGRYPGARARGFGTGRRAVSRSSPTISTTRTSGSGTASRPR